MPSMCVGGMRAHTGIHLHKDVDFSNIFKGRPCRVSHSLLSIYYPWFSFKIIDETKRTR